MTAGSPTRLPVQHPQAPHCLNCKAPLPNLNSLMVSMGWEEGDFEVLSMTFSIRCKCGAVWNLTKKARSPEPEPETARKP